MKGRRKERRGNNIFQYAQSKVKFSVKINKWNFNFIYLFFASTAVVQMYELIMTAVVYNQRFDIVQNHTYNECAHLNKYSDFSSALHGNPINPPPRRHSHDMVKA